MTRYATRNLLIAIFLPAILLALCKAEVEATPVFARKHKTSCMTCHEAFPKLNPFGESYRRRGYHFPGNDNKYVKEKPLKLGADAWKNVWPYGVWPSDIPGVPPVALQANFLYRYKNDAPVKHDLTLPDEIELLSSGTIGNAISFFATIALVEEGSEFGGIERVFIRFNDLFMGSSSKSRVNLTMGQFEPAFIILSNFRRLTHTPYMSNTSQVGKNNFQFTSQRGLEANGIFSGRIDYAVGVVNGNGTETPGNTSDNNSMKDVYAYIGYKLGGLTLDGSGMTEEDLLSTHRDERSIHMKAFGYIGENRLDMQQEVNDRFNRYGLGVDLRYDNVNLLGTLSIGNHKNPNNDSRRYGIFSYTVEADVVIYPWLIGIARYENVDVDYSPMRDEVVLAVAALLRANLKLTIEGSLHTMGNDGDTAIARLDLVF